MSDPLLGNVGRWDWVVNLDRGQPWRHLWTLRDCVGGWDRRIKSSGSDLATILRSYTYTPPERHTNVVSLIINCSKCLHIFLFFFFYASTQYKTLMAYDTRKNATIPMDTHPNFIWKDHRLPNDVPGLGKTFLLGFLSPTWFPCKLYGEACFSFLLNLTWTFWACKCGFYKSRELHKYSRILS